MNFSFLDKAKELFPTACVSVWMDFRSCVLKLELIKKNVTIFEEKKSFRAFGNEIPIEAQRLILGYQEKHRFCYVGTMFKGSNQGALPAYKKSDYKRFGVGGLEDINIIPLEEGWSFYAYGSDMVSTKSRYDKSGGIDFIFSPFFILYKFYENNFSSKPKLYLLIQKSSVTITIFRDKKLLYSSFYILESISQVIEHTQDKDGDEDGDIVGVDDENDLDGTENDQEAGEKSGDDDEDGEDTSQNLDELVSLDEEFEDIGELEELNDEDKIDEFQEESEQQSEIQKGKKQEQKESEEIGDSLSELDRGMKIIDFVKLGMSEYYKNDLYESHFIEDVEIADSIGVSEDVLDYIKDELLLNINIKKIDIVDEISRAMKKEFSS